MTLNELRTRQTKKLPASCECKETSDHVLEIGRDGEGVLVDSPNGLHYMIWCRGKLVEVEEYWEA